MSRPATHDHQAIPLSDPDVPPGEDEGMQMEDEDSNDPAAHNSATLEQNRTVASNRRQDKR